MGKNNEKPKKLSLVSHEKVDVYDAELKKDVKMLPATFASLKNKKIEGKNDLRFHLGKGESAISADNSGSGDEKSEGGGNE